MLARADKELLVCSTSTSQIVSQCNCLGSLKIIQRTVITGLESVEFFFWMSFPVQWEVFVSAYHTAYDIILKIGLRVLETEALDLKDNFLMWRF